MGEPSVLNILDIIGTVFKYTWWIILPLGLYSIFRPLWASYVVNILFFGGEINQTLLQIKIPKDMQASPKAMENVLAGLLAAARTITKYHNIMLGRIQDYFSFEIVGQEGDVSFYILAPARSVRLAEKLFYSQFPDVEISVAREDYFKRLPATIPDDNWGMWGAKVILDQEDCRPLNTYPMMEDRIAGELVDPLAIIFEAMGTLGPGEHLIYQVQASVDSGEWRKKGEEEIKKIMEKYKVGVDLTDEEGVMTKTLPPHEVDLVKAINAKMSKPAFATQILLVYVARKEVYNGIMPSTISGALRMLDSNYNNLITDKYYSTTAYYLFAKNRRAFRSRRLFKLMQDRDIQGTANVLNVEELATLFHFPTPMMKVPSVPRLDSKTAPAPSNLPVAE